MFIFWFSPLSLSCKLVCLPHTSIDSGDSQRLGLSLNIELRALFWLSLLCGSFPHSLVTMVILGSFSPGSSSQNYGGLSIGILATPTAATLKQNQRKLGIYSEPLLALHFDSPPKCEKFSLQSLQVVVLYVVRFDQVLPLEFFFFC